MLRRTFLKLIGAVVIASNLSQGDGDSMVLDKCCPWKPPNYHIGTIVTDRITGVKLVCVGIDKEIPCW